MARRRLKGKRVNPLVALATLNRALGDTAEYAEARRRIVERYGRLLPSGNLMLCKPPRAELLSGEVKGAFKVIYDSEHDALKAAQELSTLGAPPMTFYPCPRSRRGHLHLKTLDGYHFEKEC